MGTVPERLPRFTDPEVAYTGPADPDWGYITVDPPDEMHVCGRCGLAIGKVGPHMDWHRWLDVELSGIRQQASNAYSIALSAEHGYGRGCA